MLITKLTAPSPADELSEFVECKGLGHPDTITDALAENLSRNLSRFYVERFGAPMHHNVDKALLWGGAARASFGGGEVLEPMEIFLAGRATCSYKGVDVPVEELAIEGSRQWLGEHLRYLDPVRHVRLHCLVRPTSRDLVDLFERGMRSGNVLANDSSIGVGYFPLSPVEKSVLHAARVLNDDATRASLPAVGEDVKVMGVRQRADWRLTVACAMVGGHLRDLEDYRAVKAEVARRVERVAAENATSRTAAVEVNAADGESADSVYLTVTGTSAEAGDDGQVGRGNRGNGLITPYRPMSLEAVSGKNAVSHTGKLYDYAARRIAQHAVTQVEGIIEAHCYLVSRIGRAISDPEAVHVAVRLEAGQKLEGVSRQIEEITHETLRGLPMLWRDLLTAS